MSSVWAIRRSATDHKVAGVCGGLARDWGVDPVVVRLGCALLALSGGIGIVGYLVAWLLIPLDGSDHPAAVERWGRRAGSGPRAVWLVLGTIACLLAVSVLGSLAPFGLGPAAVLTLIWYFGYYKTRPHRVRRELPVDQAADAWRLPMGWEPDGPADTLPPAYPAGRGQTYVDVWPPLAEVARDDEAVPAPVAAAPVAARPISVPIRRSRTRSARRLRLGSLIVLALVLAALRLADRPGTIVPTAAYFAAALLVLGLTLIAAAFLGRARGLLPIALLVLVGTLASAITGPVAAEAGWRTQRVSYSSPSQLSGGDNRKLGLLQVDLTRLPLTTNVSYAAHVGIGALEVTVPKDTNVLLHYKVRSGTVLTDGRNADTGAGLHGDLSLPGTGRLQPTLTLNLSVDRGVVQVRR